MTKSLIIVRAGQKSLHSGWIDKGVARNWDLYVCPYQEVPFKSDESSQLIVGPIVPGPKWSGLYSLLKDWNGWREYDYIMLADDDLSAEPSVWSRFFEIISEEKAALSQPALTQESFFSHFITLQNKNFICRSTTFVEIMMPCFRLDTLEAILPTLGLTETGWGWGLDFVWPHILKNQGIMIVDETPVTHTRPVGSTTDAVLKRKIKTEMNELLKIYGAPMIYKTLSGKKIGGHDLRANTVEFLSPYFFGYWTYIKRDPIKNTRKFIRCQLLS